MRVSSCFLVVLPLFLGCGSGSPFDYTRVSGRITYEDGTPIPGGGLRLVFVAVEAAPIGTAHPRPALANTDAEGKFECVTSYKYCDGLIPGKHKVVIQSASEQAGRVVVPREYMSELTTPLVVDTADSPLEIKVPKPQTQRRQ
jgi:hypothetical protein